MRLVNQEHKQIAIFDRWMISVVEEKYLQMLKKSQRVRKIVIKSFDLAQNYNIEGW